jgi:hypothetical protein
MKRSTGATLCKNSLLHEIVDGQGAAQAPRGIASLITAPTHRRRPLLCAVSP